MELKNTKEIEIRGEKYLLSPRTAFDKLELIEAIQRHNPDDYTQSDQMIEVTQVLVDSLTETGRRLPRYNFRERLRYWKLKRSGIMFLLKNMTTESINTACNQILELEGDKKKEVENPGRSSVEQSQEG
jgi:hypothetical protein